MHRSSLRPLRPGLVLAFVVAITTAVMPSRTDAQNNALLWRVDAPDQGGTSYLLGTMHVSDTRITQAVPPEVYAALDASHTAVFELVLGQGGNGALVQRMLIDDGRHLDDILGKSLFDRLKVVAQAYGMIPSSLRYLEPWAVFLMMSVPPEETFRQARGEVSLDGLLQEYAASRGKRLVALETIDEQLAVFEEMSEADQIAIMEEMVERKPDLDALYEEVLLAYVDRDLVHLYEVVSTAGEGDAMLADRFNQRLILERNDRMAERLLPMVGEGGHFVAVGAMHLPGENGLLAQLEAAGFAMSPVI